VDDQQRWIMLIKDLRSEHGFGIYEAQELALRDPVWRRWVQAQINTDKRCRKQALSHIRDHGSASLIVGDGDLLRVRLA
jgi:hypothetical protein